MYYVSLNDFCQVRKKTLDLGLELVSSRNVKDVADFLKKEVVKCVRSDCIFVYIYL